jgi:hypothetical protein
MVAVTPDGHVESTAAPLRARCLGQPHLVRHRTSGKRAIRQQEIFGIFARPFREHLRQDVLTVDQRPDLYVRTPLRRIRNGDVEAKATLLVSHRLIVGPAASGSRTIIHG